jgi:hypothetical protein
VASVIRPGSAANALICRNVSQVIRIPKILNVPFSPGFIVEAVLRGDQDRVAVGVVSDDRLAQDGVAGDVACIRPAPLLFPTLKLAFFVSLNYFVRLLY